MNSIIKSCAAAVVALSFLVCDQARAQDKPEANPAHQELRQFRDDLLATMNRGDLDGVLKFLHTNCVITWHNAEVSRGHDGVRAYFDKVMRGPKKLVESFNCAVNVDELTIFHAENMGLCFGSSDEHFKLTSGKNLDVKGRWTATLQKENGRWLVTSLHASTNLFDNAILDIAKRMTVIAAVAALILGLLVGWFLARRRKPASATA